MGRHYESLALSKSDRIVLEQLAEKPGDVDRRLAIRAKMVLGCAEGKPIIEIAKEVGERPNTVIKWRDRYRKQGLEGLSDKKKSNRESKYDETFDAQVRAKLLEMPPEGKESWDGYSLAKALNVPPTAIWNYLRKEKITLVRQRKWNLSTEDGFHSSTINIAGIYLSQNINAIVLLSGDEAMHLGKGTLIIPNKNAYRMIEEAHQSDGTLKLEDAMEAYSVAVQGTDARTMDYVSFLNEINNARHKVNLYVVATESTEGAISLQWKIQHPNIKFCQSGYCEWLDQVDLWCNVLSTTEASVIHERIHTLSDYKELDDNTPAFVWLR